MNRIFEASDICYSYDDDTAALDGLSFILGEAEKLGVVGANGSGKSTLLYHLIGCLSPDSGEIKYKGASIVGSGGMKQQLRRETGFLFQNPDDQLFLPTVGEDAAFAPRNLRMPVDDIERNVTRALETVGISAIRNRSPWKLSGGEKTLAALAGLLAAEPQTLLLDEPTSGLDPASRENIVGILKELPCSMVIATHDLDMVLDICDRVVILNKGKIFGESALPGLLADNGFMMSCGLRLPLTIRARA